VEILIERCARLDVHAETIVVCVITGNNDKKLLKEIETFPILPKHLYLLLKRLEGYKVTHIAMESTVVYRKHVFNILENFFDITLANVQRIKNVPGRKTDVPGAE